MLHPVKGTPRATIDRTVATANDLRLIPKNVLVTERIGSDDQPCNSVFVEALLVPFRIPFFDLLEITLPKGRSVSCAVLAMPSS